MRPKISVLVLGAILVAVVAIYLDLRDPRIDTSVTGDATDAELHAALSPCPRTYNSWPFESDIAQTAPSIRANAWYQIESVGEVIDETQNGTQTITVEATPADPDGQSVADRIEAVDGGPWLPTYFEWGIREAKGTYVSTIPSSYGDRPLVVNIVFELDDGRWFLPGCDGGPYLTGLVNDATARTGRTVIELTGKALDEFLQGTLG